MTDAQKKEITKIAKEFSAPFYELFGGINGSGWGIVDPLAGYLSFVGHENKLFEIPANDKHPQVLVIQFKDGTQFIPAGADLKPIHKSAKNWQWI